MRKTLKMFWTKSRDILIETFTVVKRVEKNFNAHEIKQDKQISGLHDLIKDCHESCPEKEQIEVDRKNQGDTLFRMEKKYDSFYKEHQVELGGVNEKMNALETTKVTKREILGTCLIYITIAGIITGSILGYMRYQKTAETTKIEKMLEQILEK